MNKYLIALFSNIVFSISACYAQGYDHSWIMGTHEYPGTPGYNNAILHFQPGGQVNVELRDLKMNFESTVGVISDPLGSGLLFYTNGCYVATADGDTMPGSTGLNPGTIHEWVCDKTGYICPRGAMILPMPGQSSRYYIFHMGARYDPVRKLTYGPFYYSVVDMSLNDGKGAVISKNNILGDGDLEPFTAVRHGNGRDWWLLVPHYASNKYDLFLLGSSSVEGPYWQEIGPVMNCRRIGSSTFSQPGGKYARAQNCQAVVLNFDRCTGVLANPVLLDLPDHTIGGGGVAFTSDEKRLLVSAQLQIYAADLTESSPSLDSTFAWDYQWGISLQQMQYTPHGQIVLNHMHRTNYLSIIKNPDGTALKMQFLPQFSLPITSVRTLPNFTQFSPRRPCQFPLRYPRHQSNL